MRYRVLCIFLLFSLKVLSQKLNEPDSIRIARQANDSLNNGQKDIGDFFKGKFFHPFFGKPDTVAKQKGKIYKALLPGIGYSQATQFFGGLSLAASFYTGHPDSVNLSVINW